MEKFRDKKILTIIVLVVAVVGLSVGFAAFSSVLTISSSASVRPNASTFSVKFSKVSDEILDGESNPVIPTSGNGEGAIIDNTTNPAITGLKANFTAPGENVVYRFYVRNEGEYLAYLNSIEIGSKSCTPGLGADPSLVASACDSIGISVKVGSMDPVTSTQEMITGQTLAVDTYQEVIVTLSYASNGTRVDGPFNVKLGNVYLTYSSVNDFEFIPNVPSMGYTGTIYSNSSRFVKVGDSIEIQEWCAEMPGLGSSCDGGMIFNTKTDCEVEVENLKNSEDLDEEMQFIIENTTCEPRNVFYGETDLANIDTNVYLKFEVENNIITVGYACATYTEDGVRKDVCLRGESRSYYPYNQEMIRSTESYFNTAEDSTYVINDSITDYTSSSLSLKLRLEIDDVSVSDFTISCGFIYASGDNVNHELTNSFSCIQH